jgi:hypothetical protein
MSFQELLERFAATAAAGDARALAALFTPDGCYDDCFFGEHHGHVAIAAMLDRFFVGGERFAWQFFDAVGDETLGYASYCFSYRSKEPESAGQLIVFEGMSRFRLSPQALIRHYGEVCDRGVAFAQLGYATERIGKLLARYAAGSRQSESVRAHLAWRERVGAG